MKKDIVSEACEKADDNTYKSKMVVLNRITDNATTGDLVRCSNCGRLMLVDIGEEKCPECEEEGTMAWVDDQQEHSIYENELLLVDVEE